MTDWLDFLYVIATAIGAYTWLILVLRLTGKRSLSKLNAFDFAITVAFGSALATVVIDENVGLLRGALVLAMLALLQYAVTKLSLASTFIRKVVRSRPTLLVREGRIYPDALSYERVTVDELAEAIRNNGFGSLGNVAAVVLETDGSFSVLSGEFESFDLVYDVRRIGEPSNEPMDERRRHRTDDGDVGSRRGTQATSKKAGKK